LFVSACGLGEQIAQKRKGEIFSLSACGLFLRDIMRMRRFLSLFGYCVCASEHIGIRDILNTKG